MGIDPGNDRDTISYILLKKAISWLQALSSVMLMQLIRSILTVLQAVQDSGKCLSTTHCDLLAASHP